MATNSLLEPVGARTRNGVWGAILALAILSLGYWSVRYFSTSDLAARWSHLAGVGISLMLGSQSLRELVTRDHRNRWFFGVIWGVGFIVATVGLLKSSG